MRPLQLKTQARRWFLYLTGSPIRSGTSVEDDRRGRLLFLSFLRKQESRLLFQAVRTNGGAEEKEKTLDPRLLMSRMTGGRGDDGKCLSNSVCQNRRVTQPLSPEAKRCDTGIPGMTKPCIAIMFAKRKFADPGVPELVKQKRSYGTSSPPCALDVRVRPFHRVPARHIT